jgi:molybdopterin molybdotransferase
MPEDLLDLDTAWGCIEREVQPLEVQSVGLEAALGRVLRSAVHADRDVPPFDRAAMDGFAVRAADVAGAGPATPVPLAVRGEAAPGRAFVAGADPGGAVRVMTGAPVPAGWDAVVPLESTSGFDADPVRVHHAVGAGENITPRGAERRAGEPVYRPGRLLAAADIGALALIGVTRVDVGRRPRLAVLSTGDELVASARQPGPVQVRDANGPMLAALASGLAEVQDLGRVPDGRAELRTRLSRGLLADTLLVSGGVSMGAYDLVASTLEAAGVKLHFHRVALQPGKPVLFGTHSGGAVVALPGNPVSAFTTFRLFARAALLRQHGADSCRPRWGQREARFAWERRAAGKCIFLPGLQTAGDGVERVPYAGSGDVLAYARADCQIVLPPALERVRPGDPVAVWPW